MKAVLMVGISGSGKSTKARKDYPGYEVVERDAFRRVILTEQGKMDENTNLWSVWKFGKAEEDVTKAVDVRLGWLAGQGKNVVIADTNLSEKTRKAMTKKLEGLGYEVSLDVCKIDLLKAFERDERRRDTVGRDVIYKQYKQFLEFEGRKKYEGTPGKPRAIMVDIDGTLAHMNGKRGAFEWDKVGVDDLDVVVANVVALTSSVAEVIVMSGRDGSCEAETRAWLDKHGVPYNHLFMRAPKDMRKDSIVKEELFWSKVAPNFDVKFVIDDRPQVCRMWRELGVFTFQVGDPMVEF